MINSCKICILIYSNEEEKKKLIGIRFVIYHSLIFILKVYLYWLR